MGHNLNDTWVLWFHNPVDCNWGIDSYKKITEISTVEDFWKLNEVINEDHVINSMLFFMRDGINPMWEDNRNITGGCWSFKIPKKDVYNCWTELSITLLGESVSTKVENSSIINGISISPKKGFCIIKIWNSDSKKSSINLLSKNIPHLFLNTSIYKAHKV